MLKKACDSNSIIVKEKERNKKKENKIKKKKNVNDKIVPKILIFFSYRREGIYI